MKSLPHSRITSLLVLLFIVTHLSCTLAETQTQTETKEGFVKATPESISSKWSDIKKYLTSASSTATAKTNTNNANDPPLQTKNDKERPPLPQKLPLLPKLPPLPKTTTTTTNTQTQTNTQTYTPPKKNKKKNKDFIWPDKKPPTTIVIPKGEDVNSINEWGFQTDEKRESYVHVNSSIFSDDFGGGNLESDDKPSPSTNVDSDTVESAASLASLTALSEITSKLHTRLTKTFTKATSPSCRAKITQAMAEYTQAIGGETPLPYTSTTFESECPSNNAIPGSTRRDDDTNSGSDGVFLDSTDMNLCYVILTHKDSESTIRLIDALGGGSAGVNGKGITSFVIHVDRRPSSQATNDELIEHYSTNPTVRVVPQTMQIEVNWGGFSMVQATLNAMAFAVGYMNDNPYPFDKLINLSSTTYPLKPQSVVRKLLASYPIDTNFMETRLKPNTPKFSAWHYNVECDGAVHRIYRLPYPLGIDLFVGSQWFFVGRGFVEFLIRPFMSEAFIAEAYTWPDLHKESKVVGQYYAYGSKVVVADENYFATILHSSPFCRNFVVDNYLHMQFDAWENDLNKSKETRDERKCLMPAVNHCGRSPTTMTTDYIGVLEMSGDLFARKFEKEPVDNETVNVLDVLDSNLRLLEQHELTHGHLKETYSKSELVSGLNVFGDPSVTGVIVSKSTIGWKQPLCLGFISSDKMRSVILQPCFSADVEDMVVRQNSKNVSDWIDRGIDQIHVNKRAALNLGPCSTDGTISHAPGQPIQPIAGEFTKLGPTCKIRPELTEGMLDLCLDLEGENMKVGAGVLFYKCTGRWNQYFNFGGAITSTGEVVNGTPALWTIHLTIPSHIIKWKHASGTEQEQILCLSLNGEDGNWAKGKRPVDVGSKVVTRGCREEVGKWDEWVVVNVRPGVVEEEIAVVEEMDELTVGENDEETANEGEDEDKTKDEL